MSDRASARRAVHRCLLLAFFLLAGCELLTDKPTPEAADQAGIPRETRTPAIPAQPPAPGPAEPAMPRTGPPIVTAFTPVRWTDLPGWRNADASAAWDAFITGCGAPVLAPELREACASAVRTPRPDGPAARRFFEASFRPHRVVNEDGTDRGLITGYYEPQLRGSRHATDRYSHPVFGVPDDLLVIEFGDQRPELRDLRLRGRLEGRRVVPYYDRAGIEQRRAALTGRAIAWVADPVELFFLQIQGSGRILLDSGEVIRVGFAEHNGHPYRSIGTVLIGRGDLPANKASMQGIKEWARANPEKLQSLLNENGRYIFFRELPATGKGPPGALGVPLTPRRSIAVDPHFVPLGAPVFIATTWPLSDRPLNELVMAQDTGSAIRGAVRADYFWGHGEVAAREAGRMKQPLRMWVLLPRDGRTKPAPAYR